MVETGERHLDVRDPAVGPDDLLFERCHGKAGTHALEALLPQRVAIGVQDVGQRSPEQLLGVRRTAKPGRCLVGKYQEPTLADQYAVRRPLHEEPIGFARHARSLRIDHAGDVVTGKILPTIQCPCPADRHV